MSNDRLLTLETRFDILTTTLRELLAASTPETRERVATGLQRTLCSGSDDDAADALRAGALWELLGAEMPHPLSRYGEAVEGGPRPGSA